VTAFTLKVPTAIDNASAIVDEPKVTLSWLQDPKFTATMYSVFRSQNAGSFDLLTKTATANYQDSSYSTSGKFCYQIIYADQCGQFSPPGATICPLRLDGSLDKKNIITLTWNSYNGWKNGVKRYTVQKFNATGNLLKAFMVGTDTSFVDDQVDLVNQVVVYKIVATANDPSLANSVSNLVQIIKGVNLFYPTAFTPNGDKLNDGFKVSGHYITKLELNVFDRWGTLIFSTDKNEAWDGTYNGKLLPESTYVWSTNVTDFAGQSFTHTGTIVLLNKSK
jgi:gliding motility-associated-like protein